MMWQLLSHSGKLAQVPPLQGGLGQSRFAGEASSALIPNNSATATSSATSQPDDFFIV
jgi:hypothetical protein